MDGFISHNGNKLFCYFDNIPLNNTSISFLEANVSSINDTMSKVTFWAKPRCDENKCNQTLALRCVYLDSDSSITTKSATIYLKGC